MAKPIDASSKNFLFLSTTLFTATVEVTAMLNVDARYREISFLLDDDISKIIVKMRA